MFETIFSKIMAHSAHPKLYVIAMVILWTSALIILASVIVKFDGAARQKSKSVRTRTHIVETFVMGAVVLLAFNGLQLNLFTLKVDAVTHGMSLVYGFTLVVLHTTLHLWSKRDIGRFWSNQIVIREDHRLITSGSFAVVRHPAYASLLFWLVGLSLMFVNYGALLLTVFVFLPLLRWRAVAEDRQLALLDNTGFAVYRERHHQLLPHFGKKVSLTLQVMVTAALGFSVVAQQMDLTRVMFLSAMHLITALVISPDKTRFAWRNKSIFLLAIFGLATWLPPLQILYYVVLAFNVWGFFFNCPCMYVHEKFNRCICFSWLKRCNLKN